MGALEAMGFAPAAALRALAAVRVCVRARVGVRACERASLRASVVSFGEPAVIPGSSRILRR